MATYYSQANGAWSTVANWKDARSSGSSPESVAAMDDNVFVIQPGHDIEFDVDMSGFATGIAGLTIEGHATTPGMLYCKYSGDGTYHLKIKTGVNIIGTTAAVYGRLLANSNGVWGATGALPIGRKFIIEFAGTAAGWLSLTYLDVQFVCAQPTNKYVTVYASKITVTGSASADTLTAASHGLANGTVVAFKVTAGSLPAPLTSGVYYFVVNTATDTFKVAPNTGGTAIDLTTDGSGTIEVLTPHTSTATKELNVLEDVTADAAWSNTAGQNRVVLVDCAAAVYDMQRDSIAAITSTKITLTTNNVDSAQFSALARLYLVSRNISIRTNSTSASTYCIDFSSRVAGGASIFPYGISCEIVNIASLTIQYGTGLSGGGCQVYGTYSLIVSGFTTGVSACVGEFNGIIVGCSNAIGGGNHILSNGVIAGVSGAHYYSNSVVTGTSLEVFGCSNAFQENNQVKLNGGIISGVDQMCAGCRNVDSFGTTLKNYTRLGGSANSNFFNLTVSTPQYNSSLTIMSGPGFARLVNPIWLNPYTPYITKNIFGSSLRLSIEHNGTINSSKVLTQYCDIIKTACDGTGDAPSVDPDGGNGYCIEVSNIQVLVYRDSLFDFINPPRIWLASGTYTITYKVQTTYSSIAAGGLTLKARYVSDDSPLTVSEEIEDATAITTRSSAADWSQTIAVTITLAAAGWVYLYLELNAYEANDELYVWPVPAVT